MRLGPGLACPAIDFVDGGLVHGFDEQFVYVDVWGAAGDPDEDFGDVFGGEGTGAFIDLLGAGGVALEADEGELGFGQAGINGADADAGAVEFEAQGAGDLQFAGLGGAIGGAAFVSDMAGDGADVDDGAAGVVRA